MFNYNYDFHKNIKGLETDLDLLIFELTLIKNNVDGGSVTLYHSEVRKQAMTLISAIKESTIHPFSDFNFLVCDSIRNYVIFQLKLISIYGIPHKKRSFTASKCVEYLEGLKEQLRRSKEEEKAQGDNDKNYNWENIPF